MGDCQAFLRTDHLSFISLYGTGLAAAGLLIPASLIGLSQFWGRLVLRGNRRQCQAV